MVISFNIVKNDKDQAKGPSCELNRQDLWLPAVIAELMTHDYYKADFVIFLGRRQQKKEIDVIICF